MEDNGTIHYVRTDYEKNPITHNYEINNIETPPSYKIIQDHKQYAPAFVEVVDEHSNLFDRHISPQQCEYYVTTLPKYGLFKRF